MIHQQGVLSSHQKTKFSPIFKDSFTRIANNGLEKKSMSSYLQSSRTQHGYNGVKNSTADNCLGKESKPFHLQPSRTMDNNTQNNTVRESEGPVHNVPSSKSQFISGTSILI